MSSRRALALTIAISQFTSSCVHTTPNTNQNAPVQPHNAVNVGVADPRDPSSSEEAPWTTWYEKGDIGALRTLNKIRTELLEKNLHDPHVSYDGYRPVNCRDTNINFRSADGTCTDLQYPHSGSAGVAFGRNIPPSYIDQQAESKLMTPDSAIISKEFFTRDEFKAVPFLNMIAAVWIQFMNHDWMTHGPNNERGPLVVTAPDGSQRVFERTKTNPVNSKNYKSEFGKVSLNDVTHWWDASQIYGSSQEEQDTLRSRVDGKMKTVNPGTRRELLPKNLALDIARNKQNHGHEMTGFRDNWWVGLSMLHTLFVKEHNAIAAKLKETHVRKSPSGQLEWVNGAFRKFMTPAEIDEQIFQTARLINSAILAKIHTVEWTPGILPNPVLRTAMRTNWYGLINPETWKLRLREKSRIARHISERNWYKRFSENFRMNATDWIDSVQSGFVVGGIVGDKPNLYGVPFSITEEFTSVYRLHSLLPENIELRRLGQRTVNSVPFIATRNEKSYEIMEQNDLKDLYYSFGRQLPGQLVLNNFPQFMQDLDIPGLGKMDLGMVDIMRDRERGVPRYNQFRRAIHLKPVASYSDFFPKPKEGEDYTDAQKAVIAKFERVYGKDRLGRDNVEMIDLLVGTLAEDVRPSNFGFGETMFHIFILMASRRLMADRFFTDYYKPEYYTATGLNWIDREGTLAKVIVRHMPELAPKVRGLESAFSPWNE